MAWGQGKGRDLSDKALLNLTFCSALEKGNLTTGGELVLFWRRNHKEHKEVENDLFLKTSFWCVFKGPLTCYLFKLRLDWCYWNGLVRAGLKFYKLGSKLTESVEG